MLKKTQAAMEFRIRATTKRMLYRQENTVAIKLASLTQLTEVLETMPLIFWPFKRLERMHSKQKEIFHIQCYCCFLILTFSCNLNVLKIKIL